MPKRIRPIALGLIEHQNHIFVSQGRDKLTGEKFYRFLGGGIDFGETSAAAVAREFLEEIRAELVEVEYLSCLENIFTLDGKPKHELILLFRCRFVDPAFYQLEEQFDLVEGDRLSKAFWIKTADVLNGRCRLVPESCLAYLASE